MLKCSSIGQVLLFFIPTFFFLIKPAQATDTITVTTYYPTRYGTYNELRAKRMAVGDNFSDTASYTWGSQIDSEADLVVEGDVSIGTYSPDNVKLLVKGSTSDDTAYALAVFNLAEDPILMAQNNQRVKVGTRYCAGAGSTSFTFSVGGDVPGDCFGVDSSGDITNIRGVRYTWPSAHGTNQFLRTDGSANGVLSWASASAPSVSVENNYERTCSSKNCFNWVWLPSGDNRVCFLDKVSMRDIDTGSEEWAYCTVEVDGVYNLWWVGVYTGNKCDDCSATCGARCVSWSY